MAAAGAAATVEEAEGAAAVARGAASSARIAKSQAVAATKYARKAAAAAASLRAAEEVAYAGMARERTSVVAEVVRRLAAEVALEAFAEKKAEEAEEAAAVYLQHDLGGETAVDAKAVASNRRRACPHNAHTLGSAHARAVRLLTARLVALGGAALPHEEEQRPAHWPPRPCPNPSHRPLTLTRLRRLRRLHDQREHARRQVPLLLQ